MFCFCYSKNPSNSISIYSWNKIFLLTNVKNKCFMRKINLYFLKLSKMVKFFLFVIFNMITDSFLVEKCRTLERTRRYVCKNLLNFDCQNSIRFGIFKLLINEESFSAKCFDRNFKSWFQNLSNFLSCTLRFLNTMMFRRFITYWKIYFPLLSLTITNRGGICILRACL